ncbi:hypothetical protein HK100_003814, partial [Physocladia obscura]
GCGVRMTIVSPEGRVYSWTKELDDIEYDDLLIFQDSLNANQLADSSMNSFLDTSDVLQNFLLSPCQMGFPNLKLPEIEPFPNNTQLTNVISDQFFQDPLMMDLSLLVSSCSYNPYTQWSTDFFATPSSSAHTTNTATNSGIVPYMTKISRKRDIAFCKRKRTIINKCDTLHANWAFKIRLELVSPKKAVHCREWK